ncbi:MULTISPECIES: aldehyde dehydrogenase family protein [unclassified Pseudomonas]|uniref:aldehyde dehydrogenase family protein n=1 Tax=unclassified Pseudomonas TaxID=196821 RepID=UPI0030DCFA4D
MVEQKAARRSAEGERREHSHPHPRDNLPGVAVVHKCLAAFAFTNSLEEAERLSRELDLGVLSINHFGAPDPDTPFGGVKDSGIGREGGPWSLDSYMVSKTVLQKTVRV